MRKSDADVAVKAKGTKAPAVAAHPGAPPGRGPKTTPPAERPANTNGTPRRAQNRAAKVPPPTAAPFDAARAKQHQEAWADYLGVPAETTNSIGMKLVLIPPGQFDMGSTPEEIARALEEGKKNKEPQSWFDLVASEMPRHRVKIITPFCLGMYLVTQGEYEKVMGVNPSGFSAKPMDASAFTPPLDPRQSESREKSAKRIAGKDTGRYPVETVSWGDCAEFCRRLSALPAERAVKRTYRLPTEAEWEYACRAGTTTRWSIGDDEANLVDAAWFQKNSSGMTHPVGQKKPNPWGLYDMHGLVGQWCADWFNLGYYKQSPPNDPTGPLAGSARVLRGGPWDASLWSCRSAYHGSSAPADRHPQNGFRVLAQITAKGKPCFAIDNVFVKEVAALPAEAQIARVVAKLKELNPGYDGKEEHKIENGRVTGLAFSARALKDISPVAALKAWKSHLPR